MKSVYKSLIITASLFFLFLFAFLFVNLNQIKPTYAASCSITSASVAAGGTKTVTYSGFAAGEGFVLSPVDGSAPVATNITTSTSPTNVTIPTGTPGNTYNMVIVTRFPITYTICTGGPFAVTTAPPPSTPVCSINNTGVAAGGTKTVTYSGFAADEGFVLSPVDGSAPVAASERTLNSTGSAGSKSTNVTIPTGTPGNIYNMVIVTRFPITYTICTGGPFAVTTTTTSCLVNPKSVIAGQAFNVGGLNFDQTNPLHSVSVTGYYGSPAYNEPGWLMSFDPTTGVWTASITMPATAQSGLYVVRVDSTVCNPNLDVISLSTPASGLSCSYDTKSITQSYSMLVTHKGFAEGESIRLFGTAASAGIATTVDSTKVAKTQSVQIPVMMPNDIYNIIIVTRFPITATVCTGGPLTVGDATTSTPTCANLTDCSAGVDTGVIGYSESNLIGDIFEKFIPIALGVAGMITIVMIVISGFQFATSSGNPESAAGARGRLTFAIIGFAIVALAFALTQIIDIVFLHRSGLFG